VQGTNLMKIIAHGVRRGLLQTEYILDFTSYANQGFRLSMGGEWGHSPRKPAVGSVLTAHLHWIHIRLL